MCPLHPHGQKWGEVEASLGKEGLGGGEGKWVTFGCLRSSCGWGLVHAET